jgi:hypothetical protein
VFVPASRTLITLLFALLIAAPLLGASRLGPHWLRTHHERNLDIGAQVAVDPAGNVFYLWRAANSWLVKYDPAGNLLWEQTLTNNRVRLLAADQFGNAYVGGDINVTNSFGRGRDLYLAKIDGQTHEHLWERNETDPAGKDFSLSKLLVDPSGHLVIHSYLIPKITSSPSPPQTTDTYVAKYNSVTGSRHWQETLRAVSNNWRDTTPIAIAPNGDVAVAGSINTNFFIAKLNRTSGAPVWTNTQNGFSTSNPVYVTDVDVDSAGVVSIIGGDTDRGFAERMHFARFNATTGARLWNRTRTGATNWNSYIGPAAGIHILTTTNNQIVTASIEGQPNSQSPQILIATYSATNRAILWEKRFGIPSPKTFGCDEEPVALNLDVNGNLLLAMRTPNYSTNITEFSSTLNININSGALLSETLHPYHYVYSMAAEKDLVFVSGSYKPDPALAQFDAYLLALGKVPEITVARQADGSYLFQWPSEFAGWSLQSSALPFGSLLTNWTELPGSRTTNEFKLLTPSEPGRIYQLTR